LVADARRHATSVIDYKVEIGGMLACGIVAAWLGAGYLSRIPKSKIMGVIAVLLIGTAGLLQSKPGWTLLDQESVWRMPTTVAAELLVGTISSLLAVAGGVSSSPILISNFGADITTAGTASVLISIPIVVTGVARHWFTGHCRSQTMFANLVLPMCIGSFAGAMIGGHLAAWVPTDALRLVLTAILAVSSVKLWMKSATGRD